MKLIAGRSSGALCDSRLNKHDGLRSAVSTAHHRSRVSRISFSPVCSMLVRPAARLEDPKHLHPYGNGGQEQAQRRQSESFLTNRPEHQYVPYLARMKREHSSLFVLSQGGLPEIHGMLRHISSAAYAYGQLLHMSSVPAFQAEECLKNAAACEESARAEDQEDIKIYFMALAEHWRTLAQTAANRPGSSPFGSVR
jgi:hypothetical protein